ncbi:MAG: hypothetical protein RLZZ387_5198 [Chloroflexota bacterium]
MPQLRQRQRGSHPSADARLLARPYTPAMPGKPGLHRLGIGGRRETLLYVPEGYTPQQPAPLAVMLHGAGGQAQHGLDLLRRVADAAGIILVAPASRASTWDVITGDYGPDVVLLDLALRQVFERYAVDRARIAVGGFSDGASYALSLGLTNGDFFTHAIAFSPGFMAPPDQRGKPWLFISHGTHDEVLPIEMCSRRIVPMLQQAEYQVTYREFDGPHTIPPAIVDAAVAWFTPR